MLLLSTANESTDRRVTRPVDRSNLQLPEQLFARGIRLELSYETVEFSLVKAFAHRLKKRVTPNT